jgi:ATP-dependent Clp protease adaptor protein ClpS
VINLNVKLETKSKSKLKYAKPKMFNIIICNDDYTGMDFVVDILVKIFNKNIIQATELMLEIHNKGQGIAGQYTLDVAMTKKTKVEKAARENNFPLNINVEEVM